MLINIIKLISLFILICFSTSFGLYIWGFEKFLLATVVVGFFFQILLLLGIYAKMED